MNTRTLIKLLINRIFFRSRYDYQRILSKYSHVLIQPMTDLNRFSRIMPYLLVKAMQLNAVSFMVLDRDKNHYIVRAAEKKAQHLRGVSVAADSPLITELMKRKKAITLEELERAGGAEENKHFEGVAAEMKRLKSVLVIPCISESEYFHKPTLLSCINLGKKFAREPFLREDIDFLNTLANQAAISIEYAFIMEELKKNQEQVLRSEKLATVGTTTAGVAHELRNPLTYLSAVAQVLPLKWDDPKFRETVSQMLPSEVQRMQLIVDGLLDYSRSRELVLKPLDVKSVIEKALALLTYDARKNKIYIKTDFRHTAKASADPNRMMQVFMNLISNAVQAMEENGGSLTVVTADGENEVTVSIVDTGPGFSAEKAEKIFDPFFTTKEGGTGLGLSISKKIVDEHKGQITVQSVLGHGTTFTVSLPQAA